MRKEDAEELAKETLGGAFFGHYALMSKMFLLGNSNNRKKNLLRKEIFAAHREDRAKDVMICS